MDNSYQKKQEINEVFEKKLQELQDPEIAKKEFTLYQEKYGISEKELQDPEIDQDKLGYDNSNYDNYPFMLKIKDRPDYYVIEDRNIMLNGWFLSSPKRELKDGYGHYCDLKHTKSFIVDKLINRPGLHPLVIEKLNEFYEENKKKNRTEKSYFNSNDLLFYLAIMSKLADKIPVKPKNRNYYLDNPVIVKITWKEIEKRAGLTCDSRIYRDWLEFIDKVLHLEANYINSYIVKDNKYNDNSKKSIDKRLRLFDEVVLDRLESIPGITYCFTIPKSTIINLLDGVCVRYKMSELKGLTLKERLAYRYLRANYIQYRQDKKIFIKDLMGVLDQHPEFEKDIKNKELQEKIQITGKINHIGQKKRFRAAFGKNKTLKILNNLIKKKDELLTKFVGKITYVKELKRGYNYLKFNINHTIRGLNVLNFNSLEDYFISRAPYYIS